jgi:RND superfamily putative drug exporter
MATLLYRLGRFSFRRRRLVALLWAAILALTGVGAATLSGQTSNSFSIPGTDAQKALDLLEQRFPESAAGGATARVVFAAPEGQALTDPANKAAIERVVGDLNGGGQIAAVLDPLKVGAVSPDGRIAFAQVTYRVQAFELTDTSRAALERAVDTGRNAGLTVELGGDAAMEPPATSATEVIGVAVSALVLVITFGSLVAAGMPLLTAILGIAIAMLSITTATGFVELNSNSSVLALMLGLAVAIDYSLFIVSRYRHELLVGRDGEEAAGRAVGTAGSAVVFAGLTVIIALAGLSVVGIPVLTAMGLAAAFAVVVAVVIALSLLPALLGFAGRRVLGRNPGKHDAEGDKVGAGMRWARFVTRRPVAVLLVSALALGLLAVPAASLRLGLPDDGSAGSDTSRRKAYDLIADGFGPGFNGPLLVVVDPPRGGDPKAVAKDVGDTLAGLAGVAAVQPAMFNQAGDTAIITVVPKSGPSSAATEGLVGAIRDKGAALRAGTGADIAVTGMTAVAIDMSAKLSDAMVPYLALVVGLAFLLLILVFRSILVPLKAALGFLLSVLATLGTVVAVFQWGWLDFLGIESTGFIMSMMPIFLIGVVFGLAMDYEVFLVTRIREEYVHGAEPKQAVVTGFQHGARVVTAAAVIMISVFGGFIFSGESLVMSMGFGLAAAVAFDAFVVRMTIVPAVMALLGRAAWWLPKWLDRALPEVDVEGEKLNRLLAPATMAADRRDDPVPAARF